MVADAYHHGILLNTITPAQVYLDAYGRLTLVADYMIARRLVKNSATPGMSDALAGAKNKVKAPQHVTASYLSSLTASVSMTCSPSYQSPEIAIGRQKKRLQQMAQKEQIGVVGQVYANMRTRDFKPRRQLPKQAPAPAFSNNGRHGASSPQRRGASSPQHKATKQRSLARGQGGRGNKPDSKTIEESSRPTEMNTEIGTPSDVFSWGLICLELFDGGRSWPDGCGEAGLDAFRRFQSKDPSCAGWSYSQVEAWCRKLPEDNENSSSASSLAARAILSEMKAAGLEKSSWKLSPDEAMQLATAVAKTKLCGDELSCLPGQQSAQPRWRNLYEMKSRFPSFGPDAAKVGTKR